MLYTLLFVFALSVGMFVANFFGSSAILPTAPIPSVDGTSLATEIIATSTSGATTSVVTPRVEATTAASPTNVVASPATALPATEPPTLPPTIEQPTATSEPPTATAVAGFVEYTVQKGDTLKSIAAAYSITVQDILDNNQVDNPDSLTVGTVLRIPQL